MDDLLRDFLAETAEHVETVQAQLVRFEQDPSDARIVANVFRLVHTIKGACGFLDLRRLEAVSHAAETLIDRLRDGVAPTREAVTLVLAAVDRLRQILDRIAASGAEPPGDDAALIAEIERCANVGPAPEPGPRPRRRDAAEFAPGPAPPERRFETVRVSSRSLERLDALAAELTVSRDEVAAAGVGGAPLRTLSTVARDFQSTMLSVRLQPLDRLFANLQRLVRDLGADLGKPCELDVGGGDIEVDRRLFESIRDPLSHALRNAVDHGIEPPQARRAAGKPGIARISLEAAQVGGELALSVHDDGRGFDFEAIRARAEALGVPGAHRAEGAALAALAFEPGLSTAREVTAISGRGIGLDVVRSKIEEIGGSVALEAPPGAGTRLAIRVPLSLAVVPILVMRCGRMRIALRHHHVDYLAEWRGTAPQAPAFLGRRAFDTESGPIPLVDLAATFGETPAPDPRFARIVCVLRAGGLRVGAILDDILDMTEAVVTTCPADVAPSILFGGAVLSADGEVTLALDPARLAEAIGLAPAPERPSVGATAGPPPPMTAWMVCRAGDAPPLAVPATALAEVAAFSEATPFEGGGAVRFRGRLLPLVAEPRASAPRHLLVVTDGERRVGFAADGVEAFFSKTRDVVATGATGGVGVAEIGGVVATVVDVVAWLDLDRARSAPGRSAIAVLVEDEAFYRDLLASALAAAGFAVETFADAAAAAARLARAPRPSAVAVDHALAPALARELDGLAAEGCPIALLGGEDAPHAPARHARVGKFDRKALAVLLGRPGEGRARAA